MTDFDENYYKTRNYVDYLERGDRYKHVAREIIDLLTKLNLINKDSTIVDFGCAVGFLMEGFIDAGYNNIIGVELSKWAIQVGRKKGLEIIEFNDLFTQPNPRKFDLMVALDVWEHNTDEDIVKTVLAVDPNAMLVRIPNSTDGGKTFHLKVSQIDPTHINCKTKEDWIFWFSQLGYYSIKLNTYSIYDSDGVTCLLLIKK